MLDSCDSHVHVFDRRFRETLDVDDLSGIAASVNDYRRVQRRLETTRSVIVTPRNYDTDNSVTLDAIRQLGLNRARGVATLRPDATDAQLETLHAGGIRGIRFTLYTLRNAPTGFEMVEPLARRIHELGWHIELHWTADQIVEHRALLERVPTSFVFDHFARIPPGSGLLHPACALVTAWLRSGRAWVKLSAPYLDSMVPEGGRFQDMNVVARTWIRTASERVLWGSDWPHTSARVAPDPESLMSILDEWTENEFAKWQVLVNNPAELYAF